MNTYIAFHSIHFTNSLDALRELIHYENEKKMKEAIVPIYVFLIMVGKHL